MLLDSNILIYAAQPEHASLREMIVERAPAVSAISLVEVLAFHRLQASDRVLLEQVFALSDVLPVSDVIVQHAARLRQQRRMSLGEGIVAGTALAHGRTLVTRNTRDFQWVPGLALLDPLLA